MVRNQSDTEAVSAITEWLLKAENIITQMRDVQSTVDNQVDLEKAQKKRFTDEKNSNVTERTKSIEKEKKRHQEAMQEIDKTFSKRSISLEEKHRHAMLAIKAKGNDAKALMDKYDISLAEAEDIFERVEQMLEARGGKLSVATRKNSLQFGSRPPEHFCPITQEVMDDPVLAMDGHTYERKAIEAWLKNHNTSPKTNMTMPSKAVVPNHSLKNMISDWEA